MNARANTPIRRIDSPGLRRILVSISWAAVVVAGSPTAPAQHQRGLLDRLGDLFGGAVEVEEVEEAQGGVARPFAVNGAPPAAHEVAERQARLDTWCLAWEEFLVRSLDLSNEQRADVHQLLINQSALSQQKWKTQPQQRQPGISRMSVVLFAGATGATASIIRGVEKGIPELLTDQQQEQYQTIRAIRKQRISGWFAERAAAIVDAELFLTGEQFAACLEDVRLQTARGKTNGLYAFHQQNHYLPYEQLGQFIRRFKKLELTTVQKRRWHDLRSGGQGHNNHVTVTIVGDADEQNEKQLNEACEAARKRYLNAVAVRSEYLTNRLQLPQEQARYLEVAGKGVTVRRLNSWKKQTREQIKNFAANPQFGFGFGNQQVGLSGPSIRSLEQDRLWKRALEKICADRKTGVLRQHNERILRGATSFVLATLDRELHLDDDQAERLEKLVEEVEPHRVAPEQFYWFEMAILARTLAQIDQQQLSGVLNTAQLECLNLIKAQFRYQGKDHATITTQHGEINLNLTLPGEPERRPPGS
jgi:hypothetical protein